MPLPSEQLAFDLVMQISTQMPPLQICLILTIPAEREPVSRYLPLHTPNILHHINLYFTTRTHSYPKLASAIKSPVPVFHVWSLTAGQAHLSLFCGSSGQAEKKALALARSLNHGSLHSCVGFLMPSLPPRHKKISKPVSFTDFLKPFQTSLGSLS